MTIYFAIFEYVVFRTWGSSANEELQDILWSEAVKPNVYNQTLSCPPC